eukprot:GHVU01165751.1.p1 GENE.GHVU01165751.1~~GHVU01165751.1.p1  ORF type:complete len:410 (-),score=41.69 GHVU01165751.1:229-1299(-)
MRDDRGRTLLFLAAQNFGRETVIQYPKVVEELLKFYKMAVEEKLPHYQTCNPHVEGKKDYGAPDQVPLELVVGDQHHPLRGNKEILSMWYRMLDPMTGSSVIAQVLRLTRSFPAIRALVYGRPSHVPIEDLMLTHRTSSGAGAGHDVLSYAVELKRWISLESIVHTLKKCYIELGKPECFESVVNGLQHAMELYDNMPAEFIAIQSPEALKMALSRTNTASVSAERYFSFLTELIKKVEEIQYAPDEYSPIEHAVKGLQTPSGVNDEGVVQTARSAEALLRPRMLRHMSPEHLKRALNCIGDASLPPSIRHFHLRPLTRVLGLDRQTVAMTKQHAAYAQQHFFIKKREDMLKVLFR